MQFALARRPRCDSNARPSAHSTESFFNDIIQVQSAAVSHEYTIMEGISGYSQVLCFASVCLLAGMRKKLKKSVDRFEIIW